MICKDGTIYTPTDTDLIAWENAYPACDVYAEIRKMASWLDANPSKRKTPAGMKRFCNSWLNRANDRGGSPIEDRITKTRDMSALDDLTQNFVDSPEIRRFFIEKYGQSFEHGRRVTR